MNRGFLCLFFLLVFSTYSPFQSLSALVSDFPDTIFSVLLCLLNLIFTSYKTIFHLIQPEPLYIYPFHQNHFMIFSRLILPFPFPLSLHFWWENSTTWVYVLSSRSLSHSEEHLTCTCSDRKEVEQRKGKSLQLMAF